MRVILSLQIPGRVGSGGYQVVHSGKISRVVRFSVVCIALDSFKNLTASLMQPTLVNAITAWWDALSLDFEIRERIRIRMFSVLVNHGGLSCGDRVKKVVRVNLYSCVFVRRGKSPRGYSPRP